MKQIEWLFFLCVSFGILVVEFATFYFSINTLGWLPFLLSCLVGVFNIFDGDKYTNKDASWLWIVPIRLTIVWGANLVFLYIYLEYHSFKKFVEYFGYTALFLEIFLSLWIGFLGAVFTMLYTSKRAKEEKMKKENEYIFIFFVAGCYLLICPTIWSDIFAMIIFIGLLIG